MISGNTEILKHMFDVGPDLNMSCKEGSFNTMKKTNAKLGKHTRTRERKRKKERDRENKQTNKHKQT